VQKGGITCLLRGGRANIILGEAVGKRKLTALDGGEEIWKRVSKYYAHVNSGFVRGKKNSST